MPFAVLSFSASDTLQLSRFVLSGPRQLKDFLEDVLCIAPPHYNPDDAASHGSDADLSAVEDDGGPRDDCYITWKDNSCVLSKGYQVDVHELLDKIEQNGWKIDQMSTSLTGSGVQCQTYVFQQQQV